MVVGRIAAAVCLVVAWTATPAIEAQSRVLELNDAGWKALERNEPDRAAKYFAEALGLSPNDPVLLMGAGASANAQGKPREAITKLQRALELKPSLTNASWLLGQIAFHEGDTALAIKTYENALKHTPGEARISSELAAWKREADTHARFEERRYDRFRVQFEGRADESTAVQATTILNKEFWRIGQKLGAYPSDSIVTILYTEQQFKDITRAPEWSNGYYDGRIRIPVAGANRDPELFREVLTHELTHAMIANMAPRGVPVWLNEGLAQYFDGSDVEAAKRRMRALDGFYPLEKLETGWSRMTADQARVAYDEGLIAVSIILERPVFGWTQLLSALSSGQPFYRAIESFGFTYADLEAQFKKGR